jgi:hypothetical protein
MILLCSLRFLLFKNSVESLAFGTSYLSALAPLREISFSSS